MKTSFTKEQLDQMVEFAEEHGLYEVIVSYESCTGIGTNIYVEDVNSLVREDITDYENW